MRRINTNMGIAAAAEALQDGAAVFAAAKRNHHFGAVKHRLEEHDYTELVGTTPTGEVIRCTGKEIMHVRAESEKRFAQALKHYKGVGPRPRLKTYELVKVEIAKPEKKLWEP